MGSLHESPQLRCYICSLSQLSHNTMVISTSRIILLLQGASSFCRIKVAAMEFNKPVALRNLYQCKNCTLHQKMVICPTFYPEIPLCPENGKFLVDRYAFTTLNYPGGMRRHVWLYDANVEFFNGKHVYLYIAGMLVLVTLISPYTLCLALFKQFQACSGRRAFRWVNKLKPVFDSYAGPYKDRYRVWTGLLLTTRTVFIVLLSANISDSPDFSLFVIGTVSSLLLLIYGQFRWRL